MRRALLFLTALTASALPIEAAAAPPDDPAISVPRYRSEHREGPLVNGSWWESFRDGKLSALVERGLTDSYDIATAQSRVDEADAVIQQNLGPLLPSLTWDTSANMAPLDSLGFQFGGTTGGSGGMGMPMSDPPELYYTASSVLNLGVEIDLTGRNTLAYRASERDAEASRRDLQAQQVNLSAAIVSAYYDVITAQLQLELVREQVTTNEELLAITRLRFENGQANAVDVLQQQQQVEAAKILVPQAETQLRTFEQQLAVLVGQTPNNRFPVADRLPALPPAPAVGRPADLLDSRPDLRAARARVDAAEMREKSARRQFAPSLRLSAQGGTQGIYIEEWNTQWFWGAGATLSVPLYDGHQSVSRLRQSKAQTRTAENQLQASTLVAMREVEDALVREQQQGKAVEAYEATARAAQAAWKESRNRYAAGIGDYLTVLATLNASQQADLNVVTARRDLIATRIQLHQALGDSNPSAGR